MLRELGPLNTAEIFNELNGYPDSKYALRHGTTPGALVNILGKNPEFEKVSDSMAVRPEDRERVAGVNGQDYPVCVWGLTTPQS